MDRETHIRLRQEAIAAKKTRREKQLAFEASRKKKVSLEWYPYPTDDPVEIVKFRMKLGRKIYAHNDKEYALCQE